MPTQEVFFEQSTASRRVVVVKSYDQAYAQEAFDSMSENAQRFLWASLALESIYESSDLPVFGAPDGEREAFMWDELLDQAREDGNLRSFFIVSESVNNKIENVYVSPDWPSAEAFAEVLINENEPCTTQITESM